MKLKLSAVLVLWLSVTLAFAMILFPPDTVTSYQEGIHTTYQFLFGDYILKIQWGRLILELLLPALLITGTLIMAKVGLEKSS